MHAGRYEATHEGTGTHIYTVVVRCADNKVITLVKLLPYTAREREARVAHRDTSHRIVTLTQSMRRLRLRILPIDPSACFCHGSSVVCDHTSTQLTRTSQDTATNNSNSINVMNNNE